MSALIMSSVYNTLHTLFVENMLGFECWQSINCLVCWQSINCLGSVKYHPGSIGSVGGQHN